MADGATIRRGRGAAFVGVYIEGLTEFRQTMRHGPAIFRKAIRQVDRRWAKRIEEVVSAAALAEGGVAARQAETIRGSAIASGLQLRAGGDGHPEFFGAEFGGGKFRPPIPKSKRHGRPGYTNQFKEFRPKPEVGYFVFPTLRSQVLPAIAEDYLGEMAEALAKAEEVQGGE